MWEPDTLPVRESFVDAARAASFLDMRRKTLLDFARNGKLPAHPIGFGQRRMWKFRISELECWMKSGAQSVQKEQTASVDRVNLLSGSPR